MQRLWNRLSDACSEFVQTVDQSKKFVVDGVRNQTSNIWRDLRHRGVELTDFDSIQDLYQKALKSILWKLAVLSQEHLRLSHVGQQLLRATHAAIEPSKKQLIEAILLGYRTAAVNFRQRDLVASACLCFGSIGIYLSKDPGWGSIGSNQLISSFAALGWTATLAAHCGNHRRAAAAATAAVLAPAAASLSTSSSKAGLGLGKVGLALSSAAAVVAGAILLV